MKQRAVVIMWQRSVEGNRRRYRSVICDRDTNTIKAIRAADPYDATTPRRRKTALKNQDPYDELIVEKREFVNHVAKRIGTNLRKAVENKKKVKVILGGNGIGKLTQVKIGKLQKYCTKAIRSSDKVEELHRAI